MTEATIRTEKLSSGPGRLASNQFGSDAGLSPSASTPTRLTPAATILFEADLELLDNLLTSLGQCARQLYVFANGPMATGIEARLKTATNATVIRSEINIGLGAALNAVAEQAKQDGHQFLLLLDQDSTPSSDLPEMLLARFQARSTNALPLAAIGPLLVPPPATNYKPIRYARHPASADAVWFIPTSGSLISLEAWRRTGPFRADYFIDGIDVEWGFRAWHRGYGSLVANDITMVHRWGTPTKEPQFVSPQILRQSDTRTYYYVRNAIDCIKLPYTPLAWKLKTTARLTGQIALLLQKRHFDLMIRKIVAMAITSAVRGEFGPVDLFLPDEKKHAV